jgi:hypothetical protein
MWSTLRASDERRPHSSAGRRDCARVFLRVSGGRGLSVRTAPGAQYHRYGAVEDVEEGCDLPEDLADDAINWFLNPKHCKLIGNSSCIGPAAARTGRTTSRRNGQTTTRGSSTTARMLPRPGLQARQVEGLNPQDHDCLRSKVFRPPPRMNVATSSSSGS